MRNMPDLRQTICRCLHIELYIWKKIIAKKDGFNPRFITSANVFSNCIQSTNQKPLLLCQEILKLPISKKLFLSGFSYVNTRIGYNNEILPLKVTSFSKLSIDLSFEQENGEI